jgi:DNA modification methylase
MVGERGGEGEMSEFVNKILNIDCKEGLLLLPDKSINCCVTSPPYYGLRDYGSLGQIGLEETPEIYVHKLVDVFREAKRVLKDDGTLWLNLGDSYNGVGQKNEQSSKSIKQISNRGAIIQDAKKIKVLKPKDLIGIPWMVAFALRADGWYLRQDIIWHKPNPMPESVTDRCTKSHEYIFLLSKSKQYYYDAESIKTVIADTTVQRLMQGIENQKGSDRVPGKTNGNMKAVGNLRKGYDHRVTGDKKFVTHSGNRDAEGNIIGGGMANKRSVWTVNTMPYKEAHFATFPEELIVDCIKAGCPEGGVVLDPFMGAGTTALVVRKLNRNYIGFELNPEYIRIAEKRLHTELGIFI